MSEKTNITFEIVEHLAVIAKFPSGWSREFNMVSWNGKEPKYDIRDWDEHYERMTKGLTFLDADMRKIVDAFLSNKNREAVERGRRYNQEKAMRREEYLSGHRKTAEENMADEENGLIQAEEAVGLEASTESVASSAEAAAARAATSDIFVDASGEREENF